jgi:hypothetical protein
MRVLVLILLALIATGCQQSGPHTTAATTAGAQQHPALRFFEADFSALQDQMMLDLADACQSRAADVALFDRCLRDRVATAFDDSGAGRAQCAFHTGFGAFLDCVAMGNTFIDVMHRMTDTSPLPKGYWSGGDTMIRALSRSVVSRGAANCRSEASAPTLDRCIDHWFEDRLNLMPSLTKRCPPDKDQTRTACLVEAVMIRFMQDHVPRLSAIGV